MVKQSIYSTKTKKATTILNEAASLLASGKTDIAIKSFHKALKLDNTFVEGHFNLGLAYQQIGNSKKAIKHFEVATNLNPSDFEAYNNLGNLFIRENEYNKALFYFKKATSINPHLSEGFYNLGVTHMTMGQYEEAIKAYKASLAIYPHNSVVLNNLGVTLEKIGKSEEALKQFKKALKINPQNANAYANIGASLISSDLRKATEYFKKAVSCNPNLESAVYNLGVCLRMLGDTKGSIENFEKAIYLSPQFSPTYGQLYHQVRQVVDWKKADKIRKDMDILTKKDLAKHQLPVETPFVSVIYEENPKKNLEIAKAWSNYIAKKIAPFSKPYVFRKKLKSEKIKIGYLSNDFRNHATLHLILGLFKSHNKKKFEIYAYSYGEEDKSSYESEIKKNTIFRDIVNYTYLKAADLINKDEIDILVDLKGHTSNSRLEIPALRPAPIQVNYLGFPGTSGADFFDYFITDKIVTPKEDKKFYSEKLIYMPDSYQINDNKQNISSKFASRQDFFLPEDKFLFCSFNQPYKIGQEVFNSWMKILKAVPNSAICILDKNREQTINLAKEAEKQGVDPKRLIYCFPIKKEDHLKRLAFCDLALDTFTCNGMTTTSDALWAGLPVITLKGKHFASRVSASLLSAVGLPELIVKTPTEYTKLAINLSKNTDKLKQIREKLDKNKLSKPLFNTERVTLYLEDAYIKIWENYKKNKKPETITIKS